MVRFRKLILFYLSHLTLADLEINGWKRLVIVLIEVSKEQAKKDRRTHGIVMTLTLPDITYLVNSHHVMMIHMTMSGRHDLYLNLTFLRRMF